MSFIFHSAILLASIGDDGVSTAGDSSFSDLILKMIFTAMLLGFWFVLGGGLAFLVYLVLTSPVRRAGRTRLFLDLLESILAQGRPLEETLMAVAHLCDRSLGVGFHLFAAWLERGFSFQEALARTPRFLSPQITAMLRTGQQIGDLKRVFPACRQLLRDSVSQTRNAVNYLFILSFVITPLGIVVLAVLNSTAFPRFQEINEGPFGGDGTGVQFLSDHFQAIITIQVLVLLGLWLVALLYTTGRRFAASALLLDFLALRIPWLRQRLQRDFSTMLAILLDAGVPEPEALALAADSTANVIFRHRAALAGHRMSQGLSLGQAVQTMDDSGEFAWRLANAFHGRGGFLQALAGWHESLDAQAFQKEQAVSQGITTALVLWSGLFVGTVAISVFHSLTSVMNSAVLW